MRDLRTSGLESSMEIRIADINDIPAIARIHIEGWQAAYGGFVDQAHLDSLSVEQRSQDWQNWMGEGESETLLAEIGGKAAGFITYGRTKTAPPGDSKIRPLYPAEIYALYLLPDFWRQGVGGALIRQAAKNLKAKKQNGLCLWVLDGNHRAKSFYEKTYGQRIGKKMIAIGPNELKEVCYGWRDLKLLITD